ncbi:hypothetical protein LPB72_16285 [Hydrogenophaga crassostreae]|uniref:Uncharacterized protein n=1 Tax=Hydrogenophaga crassostreae TaxID=1763535 RepID=A0A162SUJ5_9BURK|nr:DUF1631 family protein [Hydrogenophaga crassostreae]AOW12596.1 hypothetical protein LPB072_06800 [Hydrogenophaga crassostreae]OAD40467.1 hypothetical protein LPB72_16285 [Hydrogenophaga crassostreae]
MSDRLDGAFGACMQFAALQARAWVPRWLTQLSSALLQQEGGARSFKEKQAFGRARTVLATYREQVASRLLAEIDLLVRDAQPEAATEAGTRKPVRFNLDDLTLVDHGQVQEKVDLSRTQHVVRMTAEESASSLNAMLSSARGLAVVRGDVNPFLPDAIVSALARALATLHLDEGVRSVWMQAGAVPLGEALTQFYGEIAQFLRQRGIEPAGYLLVQKTASGRPAPAVKHDSGAHSDADSIPLSGMPGHGPQLTLRHLQTLLAGNLNGSGAEHADGSGLSNGLAYPLAAEVVALMLREVAEEKRLLRTVRDLVQRLRPGLMQLARNDPRFFADPSNSAQQLLDAITRQGLVFTSEQDSGFVEFAERTGRVVGALQSVDTEWPTRLRASLQRFLPAAGAHATTREADLASTQSQFQRRAVAACGTRVRDDEADDEPPAFLDTIPMDRDALHKEHQTVPPTHS